VGLGLPQRPNSTTPFQIMGVCGVVVVEGTPDQRLAALADAQWGRVSREQLLLIGFTPAMIKSRLRSGALRTVFRGVYAVGHAVHTDLGDEVAALLVCRQQTVLSHATAAALWQIMPKPKRAVHVTVLPSRQADSREGISVHRSRSLTRADIRRHRGLPLTSAARTMIDLADACTSREFEKALDEALARRRVSPTSLREAAARAPGRQGAGILLALLDPARGRGPTRGDAEERMLELLREAGLGGAERNVELGPYTVDFLWRAAHAAIEVDSYRWHSGPASFKRDRRKDAYLADRGIRLIRVTWEMMDQPLPLIARIARAIAPR